jgi:hypothetical protein
LGLKTRNISKTEQYFRFASSGPRRSNLLVAPQWAGVAHVYFEEELGRRSAANLLTRDEARRIAAKSPSCRNSSKAGQHRDVVNVLRGHTLHLANNCWFRLPPRLPQLGYHGNTGELTGQDALELGDLMRLRSETALLMMRSWSGVSITAISFPSPQRTLAPGASPRGSVQCVAVAGATSHPLSLAAHSYSLARTTCCSDCANSSSQTRGGQRRGGLGVPNNDNAEVS